MYEDLKAFHSQEMLLIDDSLEKIESVLQNGIKGLRYQNNSQISIDLKATLSQ
jgi:hypothetical protein